jgi:hypothetical protein
LLSRMMSPKAIWFTASLTSPPDAFSSCYAQLKGQGRAALRRARHTCTTGRGRAAAALRCAACRSVQTPAVERLWRRISNSGGGASADLTDVLRVDEREDAVQPEVGRDPRVAEEGECYGCRVGQARGFQQDGVVLAACALRAALQLAKRTHNVVAQRAAHAALVHGHQVLLGKKIVGDCAEGKRAGERSAPARGGRGRGGGGTAARRPARGSRAARSPSELSMLISPTCGQARGGGRGSGARGRHGKLGVDMGGRQPRGHRLLPRTSFSTTATLLDPFCLRMWLSSVVLPLPRNPVTCGRAGGRSRGSRGAPRPPPGPRGAFAAWGARPGA